MPTQLKSNCPKCGAVVRANESLVGKRVRCPTCKEQFELILVQFSPSSPSLEQAPQAHETMTPASSDTSRSPDLYPPSHGARKSTELGKLGRFELRELLGQGAFGRVYKAYDPQLDRFVAIKVPTFGLEDKHKVQRFIAEARAAARLRHPNIVPVFDSGSDQGQLLIASAFIEGQTLAARMDLDRPDFRESVRIVIAIASALDCAHGQGIVHRDVKPGNVMLDSKGVPLLMDFGLARIREDDHKLTYDGSVLGTPAYMSPEQAAGKLDQVGPVSDQYSLGAVLYELLCGKRPFDGPAALVISQVISQNPASPTTVNSTIPRDLEAICLKALSKTPGDRYSTCQDFADDLSRWLVSESIQARQPFKARILHWSKAPPKLIGRFSSILKQRWTLRRGIAAGTAGGVLAAVLVGIMILINTLSGQRRKEIEDPIAIGNHIGTDANSTTLIVTPVSWWKAEGTAADAVDGNSGTLLNGTTFAPGKVGQAFQFDGVYDAVQISDAANQRPPQITVEAWVRFDALVSTNSGVAPKGLQYLIFKKNTRSIFFEGYSLSKQADNAFEFTVSSPSGKQFSARSSTSATINQWYHVAGTYDGSSLRLYVNGVLERTVLAGIALHYGRRPLFLGATGEPYDGKLAGRLDEVAIYDRALDPTEIQSIFAADSAGKTASSPGQTFLSHNKSKDTSKALDLARLAKATGKPLRPDPELVAAAKRKLREGFQAEFANTKKKERTKSVKTILERAQKTTDSELQFALLELASDAAMEVGDFSSAMEACTEIARLFFVDGLQIKFETIVRGASLAPRGKPAQESLAQAALAAGFEMLAADNFADARKLATIAVAAATATGDDCWIRQAALLADDITRTAAGFNRVTKSLQRLKSEPANSPANAEVGKFLCLVRNEWNKGLPLLSIGDDTAFKTIAEAELRKPVAADDLLRMADSWWELSVKANSADQSSCCQRAEYWYLKWLEQMALSSQSTPRVMEVVRRIDGLAAEPLTLQIRFKGVGQSHHLRITNDGIQTIAPSNTESVQINHLRWAGRVSSHVNLGAQRVLPNVVDFSRAEVRNSSCNQNGHLQFDVGFDHLDVRCGKVYGGTADMNLTVTFYTDSPAHLNRAAPRWQYSVYKLKGYPGSDESFWKTAVLSQPLEVGKKNRLFFNNDDSPFSSKVQRDNFGIVATSEWDLPAGDYEIITQHDDGMRVFLDDSQLPVVDRWQKPGGNPPDPEERKRITLSQGLHRFRVEFWQGGWHSLFNFVLKPLPKQ